MARPIKTFAIPAGAYADASLFVSPDPTRFYLCGVAVTPAGHAVATDGHRMFVADLGADFRIPEAVIVPLDKAVISAARKHAKVYSGVWLVVAPAGSDPLDVTLSVVVGKDASEAIKADGKSVLAMARGGLIDGTFPDYGRCIPANWPAKADASPAFNPRFMAGFDKVKATGAAVTLTTNDDGPMFVDLGRDDAFAILMPMRNGRAAKTPEWVYRGAKDGALEAVQRAPALAAE